MKAESTEEPPALPEDFPTPPDVALVASGEKIYAHKAILTAKSEYFKRELNEDELNLKNVDPADLKIILKYIYTGHLYLENQTTNTLLKVLDLTHNFLLTQLKFTLVQNLENREINSENVVSILNSARVYQLPELIAKCEVFMDKNAEEVLKNKRFLQLSEESLSGVLMRDSFYAPEIDIFQAVMKWSRDKNKNEFVQAVKNIRFNLIDVSDIEKIVKPSLTEDICLDLTNFPSRLLGLLVPDKDVASHETPEFKFHTIEESSTGIIIELQEISIVNNIRLLLHNPIECYAYYIKISTDRENWTEVIDYRRYNCRSWQDLYFQRCAVKYINIVGTRTSSIHKELRLESCEAYFQSSVPKFNELSIVYPVHNVARSLDKTRNFFNSTDFTSIKVNETDGFVVRLTQPFMISSMKILLNEQDGRRFSFYVESSVDFLSWDLVADKRGEKCSSWQIFSFPERPVVYVRFIETYTGNKNQPLDILYVECPARQIKAQCQLEE